MLNFLNLKFQECSFNRLEMRACTKSQFSRAQQIFAPAGDILLYGICHMRHLCHIYNFLVIFGHFRHIWQKWSIRHIPYDSHIYANMGVD